MSDPEVSIFVHAYCSAEPCARKTTPGLFKKHNNTQIIFASDQMTQWKEFLMDQYVVCGERSGSVVECLTRD